jgi:hypothetical protein
MEPKFKKPQPEGVQVYLRKRLNMESLTVSLKTNSLMKAAVARENMT